MTEPYWSDGTATLYLGDMRDVLPGLPPESIDALVCDPPYELGFMGKMWDSSGVAYDSEAWRVCWRLLKPGGHLLAFGGTRTYHRMVCAIEDAGFEIRDSLHWIYGAGFPKGLDVSKAIDKAAGAQRQAIGPGPYADRGSRTDNRVYDRSTPSSSEVVTAPAAEDAARWQGWNTALKPAHEPIVLARKPPAGTIASNVLAHGTGALNIEACRVPPTGESRPRVGEGSQNRRYTDRGGTNFAPLPGVWGGDPAGRWPSNLVFSHQPLLDEQGEPAGDACADGCVPGCPVAEMDKQSGIRVSGGRSWADGDRDTAAWRRAEGRTDIPQRSAYRRAGDSGGASRFFPAFRYEAKAPASERLRLPDGTAHTTVKPLTLIRWLVRLVTPPGGLVLDPFAGSGTTGEACAIEGFRALLVEKHQPYAELIKVRLSKPIQAALEIAP